MNLQLNSQVTTLQLHVDLINVLHIVEIETWFSLNVPNVEKKMLHTKHNVYAYMHLML